MDEGEERLCPKDRNACGAGAAPRIYRLPVPWDAVLSGLRRPAGPPDPSVSTPFVLALLAGVAGRAGATRGGGW